jgi:hypothetical protein
VLVSRERSVSVKTRGEIPSDQDLGDLLMGQGRLSMPKED